MSAPAPTLRPVPLTGFATAALMPLPLLAVGVLQGGAWLWLAFLYMGVLTILLDQIVPLTSGAAEGAEFPAADLLLVSVAMGVLAALPVVVWASASPMRTATMTATITAVRMILFFFLQYTLSFSQCFELSE